MSCKRHGKLIIASKTTSKEKGVLRIKQEAGTERYSGTSLKSRIRLVPEWRLAWRTAPGVLVWVVILWLP